MSGVTHAYVAFAIDGVQYAVPLAHVTEVTRPLLVVPVARSVAAVAGAADYRGELAMVVDLRVHFGVAAPSPRSRWIVLRLADLLLALVVDDVRGVVRSERLRELPTHAVGAFARDVVGALSHQGQLVFLLDTERLHDLGQRARGD